MSKKVMVGMSGGVDSSVTAYLLKQQGYDVTGVTMKIWPEGEVCGGEAAIEDAARVAKVIGIPYQVIDYREQFQQNVIQYFIDSYLAGETPNPCIACNHYIKWSGLLSYARSEGATLIATGHYGHILRLDNSRYSIQKTDSRKDQSYVLYRLSQEDLAHTIFPLAGMEKEQVRAIAQDANLPVACKKDSQDICFIPDHDYASFITHKTGLIPTPGNFVDSAGNILGTHKGLIHYTIGQRKGLGIAFGEPRYVIGLNTKNNEVVLGTLDELMTNEVLVKQVNYMSIDEADFTAPIQATGKIRYAAKDEPCTLYNLGNGSLRAVFDTPVKSKTPGQSAVFYLNGVILCGGIIQG